MTTFTYLWQFTVAPGQESRFREIYGPGGRWVRLFRTAPGWLETRLLQDRDRPKRFLTIDRWASEEAYRTFRRERAAEYDAVDAEGEGLTLEEHALGEFGEPG
jgi:heme-degrading monooxygenase HmoA